MAEWSKALGLSCNRDNTEKCHDGLRTRELGLRLKVFKVKCELTCNPINSTSWLRNMTEPCQFSWVQNGDSSSSVLRWKISREHPANCLSALLILSFHLILFSEYYDIFHLWHTNVLVSTKKITWYRSRLIYHRLVVQKLKHILAVLISKFLCFFLSQRFFF